MYSPQRVGQISTWDITMGKISKLLHPMTSGHQAQNLEYLSDIPNSSYKGNFFFLLKVTKKSSNLSFI
jgi:hypothetical protein